MFQVIFCVVAVVWAAAYAWYSMDVFIGGPDHSTWSRVWPNTPHTAFQLVLNFVGNLAGWIALYFIVFNKWGGRLSEFSKVKDVSAADLTIALIALLGITGYLPTFLSRLSGLVK